MVILDLVMQLPKWCRCCMPTPFTKRAPSRAHSLYMTPSVCQSYHFNAFWWCMQHSLASGEVLGKGSAASAHNSSRQQGKLLPCLWVFCLQMTHVAACDSSEIHSESRTRADVNSPCQSLLSIIASFIVFNAKFCCSLGDALASSANYFKKGSHQ